MDDATLLAAAIVTAIIGLAIVAVLSNASEPPSVTIATVPSHAGETVTVDAIVTRVARSDGTTFVTLSQELDAVIFADAPITEGSAVSVTGRIDDYDGAPQLVVDRVTVKDNFLNE
jgi:DNA/RNA endonuclease YhcR with UshA esterase domain